MQPFTEYFNTSAFLPAPRCYQVAMQINFECCVISNSPLYLSWLATVLERPTGVGRRPSRPVAKKAEVAQGCRRHLKRYGNNPMFSELSVRHDCCSLIWPDGNYTYPEVLNQTLTYYLASHNAEVLTRETWEEKAKKWCDKWEPGTKGSYNWVHINGNKRKLATEACKVLGQFTVKAMCMKVVEKDKPKNDGHDELKKRQSF